MPRQLPPWWKPWSARCAPPQPGVDFPATPLGTIAVICPESTRINGAARHRTGRVAREHRGDAIRESSCRRAGESGPMAAPNSVTISAGATGVSSRLPKLTTCSEGGAAGPVKSILATKPSSQGKLWLEDGNYYRCTLQGSAHPQWCAAVGKYWSGSSRPPTGSRPRRGRRPRPTRRRFRSSRWKYASVLPRHRAWRQIASPQSTTRGGYPKGVAAVSRHGLRQSAWEERRP